MRTRSAILSLVVSIPAFSQPLNEYTGHYSYVFVEDSAALVPLQGTYTVEYLARGQWWNYTDPRMPVNYAGRPLQVKPLIALGRSTLMAVEPGKDYFTTDQKLRVVRNADTLIVDLSGPHHLEAMMHARTADMELPPRPPVLLPFRKGWYDVAALTEGPANAALNKQLDALWKIERTKVLALYDTTRYAFTLELTDHRVGPLDVFIDRDPNYRTQLLHFPASGPGVTYELTRQNARGEPDPATTWRVEMDPAGETGRYVNITAVPPGKYTVRMLFATGESTFYLLLYGPAR